VTETRGSLEGMRSKYMAVLCIAGGFGGAIGFGYARLSMVNGRIPRHIEGGGNGGIRHS
jgi:hypothetical protein